MLGERNVHGAAAGERKGRFGAEENKLLPVDGVCFGVAVLFVQPAELFLELSALFERLRYGLCE